VVEEKRPKIFVAENVKGLLSIENGEVIKMIINDFKNIGYDVDYRVVNAVDFGVPQNRERVVIIGNRINIKNIFPQKSSK
jgi:DNA (cytosine-5)-methyltransferase 1